MMQIDLVSYKKETSKVYVTMEMEYLPGIIGPDTRETLLSVTGCGVPSIKISESGPTNTTSAKYTFLEDGQILGAKGHLHAGGEKMVMYINGKFACESKAMYGGEKGAAAIDNMSLCTTKPISVKKGDVLTMVASYDVSKHPVYVFPFPLNKITVTDENIAVTNQKEWDPVCLMSWACGILFSLVEVNGIGPSHLYFTVDFESTYPHPSC